MKLKKLMCLIAGALASATVWAADVTNDGTAALANR